MVRALTRHASPGGRFDPSALPYPVVQVLDDLRDALARHSAVILEAAPGAGKTTVVPPALLEESWMTGRSIVVLEPRRLAARAAAQRIAALLGESVGRTAGYRTRLDSSVSRETRIEIVTEGILTRRLQSDPELAGTGLVVFDEFHERHLQTDLALVLALDVQETIRPDLKILVMSATLDGQPLDRVLPGAPRLKAEGRQFPVEIEYLAAEPRRPAAETVAAAVLRCAASGDGDILAFLPGGGEIARATSLLAGDPAASSLAILPLYGDLPREAQDRALAPEASGRRKVILATPVAESSLTIDGVRTVVDSGLARSPRFDAASGMTRLVTVPIARANADQRSGRAGRQGPGRSLRLWTAAAQSGLAIRALPEIAQVDLAPLVLELAHWGTIDPARLRWPDPPPSGAWSQARELLIACNALDADGRITKVGRELVRLPLHPRLGLMILAARPRGTLALACDLAAILEERDLLRAGTGGGPRGDGRGTETDPDLRLRLDALHAWRATGRAPHGADGGACRIVDRVAVDLRKRISAGPPPAPESFDDAGTLLAHAYPDRIAQKRGAGWLLANGRGAETGLAGAFSGDEFIVAAHLDGRTRVARVHLAAPLTRARLVEIFEARIARETRCTWNPGERAVEAVTAVRYDALVLETRTSAQVPTETLLASFLEGTRSLGLSCLPWTDEARTFQARVESVRAWSLSPGGPALAGPSLSDDALLASWADWLAPWVSGMRKASELSRLDLLAVLESGFRWDDRRALDRLAPQALHVPSGSQVRLTYEPGRPPVLAVKLQELFGLTATPTVYEGRVPVLLHLLSPARRPIQVTQDLVSFWKNTYPEVRKELFARYPRHPWPEDPFTAPPTRRAKPRT